LVGAYENNLYFGRGQPFKWILIISND